MIAICSSPRASMWWKAVVSCDSFNSQGSLRCNTAPLHFPFLLFDSKPFTDWSSSKSIWYTKCKVSSSPKKVSAARTVMHESSAASTIGAFPEPPHCTVSRAIMEPSIQFLATAGMLPKRR